MSKLSATSPLLKEPAAGSPRLTSRAVTNRRRLRILTDDSTLAPFLHASTMDEICAVARKHKISFNEAYRRHVVAVDLRYGLARWYP